MCILKHPLEWRVLLRRFFCALATLCIHSALIFLFAPIMSPNFSPEVLQSLDALRQHFREEYRAELTGMTAEGGSFEAWARSQGTSPAQQEVLRGAWQAAQDALASQLMQLRASSTPLPDVSLPMGLVMKAEEAIREAAREQLESAEQARASWGEGNPHRWERSFAHANELAALAGSLNAVLCGTDTAPKETTEACPDPQAPVELVFERRWRKAIDGFGVVRDDVDGPFVHLDDAVQMLAAVRAGVVGWEPVDSSSLAQLFEERWGMVPGRHDLHRLEGGSYVQIEDAIFVLHTFMGASRGWARGHGCNNSERLTGLCLDPERQ